jgi:hypothetical protein
MVTYERPQHVERQPDDLYGELVFPDGYKMNF